MFIQEHKGESCLVHGGKLLKVFLHDGGAKNGGIREALVIDVPDELGKYFMDLMEQYPE